MLAAGGRGRRIHPRSVRIPKVMLEVAGKPLLVRNVELLRDALGLREIVVVVGHLADFIRQSLGDGSGLGVALRYVDNPGVDDGPLPERELRRRSQRRQLPRPLAGVRAPPVSLVIPAYNEATSIGHVIRDFRPLVDEIVVMDNVSPDGTGAIARELGAIVHSQPLRGYGDTLRTGMDVATGDILVLVEADRTANMDGLLRWGNVAVGKLIEALWGAWSRGSRTSAAPIALSGVTPTGVSVRTSPRTDRPFPPR